MEKILLSKPAFDLLIAMLINLEEKQIEILDSCFPVHTQEREDMNAMITNYIQQMDHYLERISIADSPQFDTFPFVVIGGNIIVQNIENQSINDFRLITPSVPTVNAGDISIFSPIGKAFLLKEVNSIVKYEAPEGTYHYQILAVYLVPCVT